MNCSEENPLSQPSIELDGLTIPLEDGETVLAAMERSGIEAPSGCRAGTCCKCMQQGEDPPIESQRGLRATLRSQGYFLACQARPTGRLKINSQAPLPPVYTVVQSIEVVSSDVARIHLRPSGELTFRPGQYLDVLHPSGTSRSYSIASLPSDGTLELHVRRIPDGLVSGWLHDLEEGDEVSVRGAYGQCFHVADEEKKKLLLVGAGTGLAPLLGIARDALHQGHAGPIDLVHGGLQPDRLYLREELAALADQYPQLRIHHCVLRGATKHEHEGALDEVAIRLAGPLQKVRAFLCGDEALVRQLQRNLFLAGVPSGEILADPFTPAPATL